MSAWTDWADCVRRCSHAEKCLQALSPAPEVSSECPANWQTGRCKTILRCLCFAFLCFEKEKTKKKLMQVDTCSPKRERKRGLYRNRGARRHHDEDERPPQRRIKSMRTRFVVQACTSMRTRFVDKLASPRMATRWRPARRERILPQGARADRRGECICGWSPHAPTCPGV